MLDNSSAGLLEGGAAGEIPRVKFTQDLKMVVLLRKVLVSMIDQTIQQKRLRDFVSTHLRTQRFYKLATELTKYEIDETALKSGKQVTKMRLLTSMDISKKSQTRRPKC
ncbi:MAG: hypothetical protein CM15mV111_110 [uncultured marine virus]|nr:MAG: hypothetical protein CM15mV111_110 [uncultured marine virus]